MQRKKIIYIDSTGSEFVEIGTGSLTKEIARRSNRLDSFSGLSQWLPNPDPILRKTGKTAEVFDEIRCDTRVSGDIRNRKGGTKKLKWYLNTEKVTGHEVEIVQRVLDDLKIGRLISDILEGPLNGYQPIEVVWKYDGVYLLPEKVEAKPAKWFNFDAENRLRFLSRNNVSGDLLPPRKFILIQHDATYENPYGEAILSQCFWPVTFKKGGIRFFVTFAEKYGMPWVIARHGRTYDTTEKIDQLIEDIDSMVQDGVLALSNDIDVEMVTPAAAPNAAGIYERLLAWCDHSVSTAILGHSGASESTPGQLGNETGAMAARQDIIDSDTTLVEEGVNQLIDWIYDLNFGDDLERPKFETFKANDTNETLANRDKTLTDAGVAFTRKYWMKTYSLAEEDIEAASAAMPTSSSSALDATTQGNALGAIRASNVSVDRYASVKALLAAPKLLGFAEPESRNVSIAGQSEVDTVEAEAVQPRLQDAILPTLQPILDLVSKSSDYSEVVEKLFELWPDMNAELVIDLAAKAIAISEAIGRASVDAEQED